MPARRTGCREEARPAVAEVSQIPRRRISHIVTGGKTRVEVPASRARPADRVCVAMSHIREHFDHDEGVRRMVRLYPERRTDVNFSTGLAGLVFSSAR